MPGAPSKSRPRRGVPPISLAKVLWARNRFSERTTSSLTGSMPTTSSRRVSICSGRYITCGDRPVKTNCPRITAISSRKNSDGISSSGSMLGRLKKLSGSPVRIRNQRYAVGTPTTSTRVSSRLRRRTRGCARRRRWHGAPAMPSGGPPLVPRARPPHWRSCRSLPLHPSRTATGSPTLRWRVTVHPDGASSPGAGRPTPLEADEHLRAVSPGARGFDPAGSGIHPYATTPSPDRPNARYRR